jgi:hypothetical protein
MAASVLLLAMEHLSHVMTWQVTMIVELGAVRV